MGLAGRRMKEVLVSRVTEPAAEAAGMEEPPGKGEGPMEGPPPLAEKVLTVRTSVLMGKDLTDSM
jgi:hypothetical protein